MSLAPQELGTPGHPYEDWVSLALTGEIFTGWQRDLWSKSLTEPKASVSHSLDN